MLLGLEPGLQERRTRVRLGGGEARPVTEQPRASSGQECGTEGPAASVSLSPAPAQGSCEPGGVRESGWHPDCQAHMWDSEGTWLWKG